jgi:myosin heavy subunit
MSSSPFTANSFGVPGYPDMSTDGEEITSKDPMQIAQQLQSRVMKDKPYTKIGNRCIVAVRPTKYLSINTDKASKEYAQNAKKVSNQISTAQAQPPHVFGISTSAFFHAVRGKLDQSIVLLYI